MRPIQMYVLSHWNRSRQGLDYQLVVSPAVHDYIQWWTDQRHLLSGLPLCPPEAQTVITTDASSLGWGGVLGKETQGGGGGGAI